MKLAMYVHDGATRAGVVSEAGVHPIPGDTTVTDLARAGLATALDVGRAALSEPATPLDQVRLLPPIDPPAVRDFLAFEEHNAGMLVSSGLTVQDEWYEAPMFYFCNPAYLIGAHDDVPVPPGCATFDYEVEVAVVVGAVEGSTGASLTPEEAIDHIFGYAIFNDWSARDLQAREKKIGVGFSKGKDTASTLGPWVVTADELHPHRDAEGFLPLDLTVSVNGTPYGEDSLAHMAWPFEEMVSYASRGTRVQPGDVLASGTCGNGGCLAELWGFRGRVDPPPLQVGDVVEMTVEGIGTIRNTVVAGLDLPPIPRARSRMPVRQDRR